MKKSVILIIIALIIYITTTAWYNFQLQTPVDDADTAFQEIGIVAGSGVNAIAGQLEAAGLLRSTFAFKWYVRSQDMAPKLQAGTYRLSPDMNIKDIAKVLVTGRALTDEREIKLIEGWTLKDMDEYLAENNVLQPGAFMAAAKDRYDYDFLESRPAGFDLEGFIFPDTYRIFNSATAEDIIIKTLDNFDDKLDDELRAEIARQGKSVWEIITMASLIEKEVRSYEDMRLVSGVFWNRIEIGQALESCASLAYILGVNKPVYTTEDTQVDSIYNTYKYPGLPPGPVSNPGLNAIKAAIYPQDSDYLYFLSSNIDGSTKFAESYEEHLENKRRYLK